MFSFAKAGRELSDKEQRQVALDLLLDAWSNAIDKGVEAEVVSTTAIFAALSEMVGTYGELAVADMTEDLPQRIRQGDFTVRN